MSYRILQVYFFYFLTGIFTFKYSQAVIFFILGLTISGLPFFLSILCFSCGFFLSYFFLLSFIFFNGIGVINHINSKEIYLDNVKSFQSPVGNTLKLSIDNNKILPLKVGPLKVGDNIRFSGMLYDRNRGKLLKVFSKKNGEIGFVQGKRLFIESIFDKSKFGFFLKSIVLGDRSEINENKIEIFKNSGFWHILSISGLHMNFLVLNSYRVFRKLFATSFFINYNLFSYRIPEILSLSLGIFYLFLSLNSIPALRSLCMLSSSMFFDKKINRKKFLLYLAFLFIVLDVNLAFDIGFQLSFFCTWILINRFPIFSLNLFILPIVPQISIMSFLTNYLVLNIFSIILFLSFLVIIFPITLPILDFFCKIFFFFLELPPIILKVIFNPFSLIIYIFFIIFTLYNRNIIYLITGFLIILILSKLN